MTSLCRGAPGSHSCTDDPFLLGGLSICTRVARQLRERGRGYRMMPFSYKTVEYDEGFTELAHSTLTALKAKTSHHHSLSHYH